MDVGRQSGLFVQKKESIAQARLISGVQSFRCALVIEHSLTTLIYWFLAGNHRLLAGY